jgi:Major Facilitator Superfamily
MTEAVGHTATRREWIGLAVLALPCLLYSMDLTVLNLAVPHLSADLQPSGTQLLWIVDIYGFLVAGSLITMGTLGDRIGRRRLLLTGAARISRSKPRSPRSNQRRPVPRRGSRGELRDQADRRGGARVVACRSDGSRQRDRLRVRAPTANAVGSAGRSVAVQVAAVQHITARQRAGGSLWRLERSFSSRNTSSSYWG